MNDKVKYYELYDDNGNLVVAGTAKDICKFLGVRHNRLYERLYRSGKKTEVAIKGFEVLEVGSYRKVYDACKGHTVLCTGTIDDIVENLGISKNLAMYSTSTIAHKRASGGKCDSKALLLFEHDKMIIEYH